MSHANVENEIRTTPEYAAVFALEKWRATQLKKWNGEWLDEKKKRIRDLELSFADKAEDLDGKAASLEALGERLKVGFQALESQQKDHERRERSFAAAQLQAASEQESALQTMQERCRRMVGEIQAKLDNERSKNRELEQIIHEHHTQKQMQESSNSKLNVKLLEVQKRDADHAAALAEKDKEIFDLRKDLAEAREKSAASQRLLTEAQSRIFKLEENSQFYRSEAKRVVAHHNRLLEEIFKEREEKLKKERLDLEHQMFVGTDFGGGSPGNRRHLQQRSATANCVDAALKRNRQEAGEVVGDDDDDDGGDDQEGNNANNIGKQQRKDSAAKFCAASANGMHSELRSMADMIEQLARSIDQAEERDKKRDAETAKKVSEAVRDSFFTAQQQKRRPHQNNEQGNQESEETSEMIIMDEEAEDDDDDDDVDHDHDVDEQGSRSKNSNSMFTVDGKSGNFVMKQQGSKICKTREHQGAYVGTRYLRSAEFYELRPTGFHSRAAHRHGGGVVGSSIDSGLNESDAAAALANPGSLRRQHQQHHFFESQSCPNSNEATLDSNTPTKDETTMHPQQTAKGASTRGKEKNTFSAQRREDLAALSRIPKEHRGLIVDPGEYYSRSERIPSSSIRDGKEQAASMNDDVDDDGRYNDDDDDVVEKNTNNNDDDGDDDQVRLEGDESLLELGQQKSNNDSANNPDNVNTTAVLSSLSIPESEDVDQFDNMMKSTVVVTRRNNRPTTYLDFGPHGEKIAAVSGKTKDKTTATTTTMQQGGLFFRKEASTSPGASTSASTNLQMPNRSNVTTTNRPHVSTTKKTQRQATATAAAFTSSHSSSSSAVQATNNDNRNSPLPSVPVVDSDAFLIRLQQNRDRLLETGVYKPGDRIIVEMDQRILEYRQKKMKSPVL